MQLRCNTPFRQLLETRSMNCESFAHVFIHESKVPRSRNYLWRHYQKGVLKPLYIAVHYSTLQYIIIHCSTLLYIAVHYCTLQHIIVHCCTLLYITVYLLACWPLAHACKTMAAFLIFKYCFLTCQQRTVF